MATKTLDDDATSFWEGLSMEKPRGPSCLFPSEFPYPVESILSSNETTEAQPEENEQEEDFFAELTRRLTRSLVPSDPPKLPCVYPTSSCSKSELRAVSGSPKSTLTGLGGWPSSHGGGVSATSSPMGGSSGRSPPSTPFGVDADQPNWDLLYAAAGQVARLSIRKTHKSHSLVTAATEKTQNGFCSSQSVSFGQSLTKQNARNGQMPKSCSPVWARNAKMKAFDQHIQSRTRGIAYESTNRRCGAAQPLGFTNSAWSNLHARNALPHQNVPNLRPSLVNGSGITKERAGTGVFLPRSFENAAPEPLKKSVPTVLVPAKVVQALNLNLDNINAHSQYQHYFTSDYENIMARRNTHMAHQKKNVCTVVGTAHEIRLPQEWTY